MESMETLNMKPVTVKQFTRLIREGIEDNDLTPIIGIGKSGVGKTECVYELTQEMNIGFCELRLVTMTETDLLGIPDIEKRGGKKVTTWASNELLPISVYDEKTGRWVGVPKEEGGDGVTGVLVLDEITSATSTIRAAAYQLLDSKRALGNYHLPDGWLVVALGNGPDDGGVFQGMECAFLSRARCLRIEPDFKTWKKWAISKGVNPTIIAYLGSTGDGQLHKFDPNAMASVFPCPRSWVSLSKKLNDREKRNNGMPLDQESVDIYTASCVGQEVACMFGAFYTYNKDIVKVEDVLSGKAKTDIDITNPEVMYITVQNLVRALAHELKLGKVGSCEFKEETVKIVANACRWIIGVGKKQLDLAITSLTDLRENVEEFGELVIQDDKFDELCPELLDFAQENSIVFGK